MENGHVQHVGEHIIVTDESEGKRREEALAAAVAAMNSDAFRQVLRERERKERQERRRALIRRVLMVLFAGAALGLFACAIVKFL